MFDLVIRPIDPGFHFSQLWSNHKIYQISNILTDLHLSTDSGPPVNIHLALFLPLSPLLGQVVNDPRMRGEDPLILLPGVSQSSVMSLVSLLYTGSCPHTEGTSCQEILRLAESLGMCIDRDRLETINQELKIKYKPEQDICEQSHVCLEIDTEVPYKSENYCQIIKNESGSNMIPCVKKPSETRRGCLVKDSKDGSGRSPSQAFRYFCKSCSYRSRTAENLTKHKKSSHDNIGRITCELKTGKNNKCKVCGWRATTLRKLSLPMHAVHTGLENQLVKDTGGLNNNNDLYHNLKLCGNRSRRSTRGHANVNESSTVTLNDYKEEISYGEYIEPDVDFKNHDSELESMVKCEENLEDPHLSRSPVRTRGTPAKFGATPAISCGTPLESSITSATPGGTPAISGKTPSKSGNIPSKSGKTPSKSGKTPVKSGFTIDWDKKEVSLMLGWFAENNSPSHKKLLAYVKRINRLKIRLAKGHPVTAANLSVWFMNKNSTDWFKSLTYTNAFGK